MSAFLPNTFSTSLFSIGSMSISANREAKSFANYTATGIATTLIFWVVEYAFHTITQSDFWRYVGAVLGLILGYTIKFFLDRRLVFRTHEILR